MKNEQYNIERISNGLLVKMPDGKRKFFSTPDELAEHAIDKFKDEAFNVSNTTMFLRIEWDFNMPQPADK